MGEIYQLYTPGDDELTGWEVELVDRSSIQPVQGGSVSATETKREENLGKNAVEHLGQAATDFTRVPGVFAHHDYSKVKF